MSWLTDTYHYYRCLKHQKRTERLRPPRPLDLAVLVYDGAEDLRVFLDSVMRNTQWPLRIHLCDAISSDNSTRELLKLWDGKKAGIHEIRALFNLSRIFPEAINTVLRGISSDVFLISEGRVVIPSLPKSCWTTRFLQTMEINPHVGWLNATVDLPSLPGISALSRKPVRGTNGKVLRDSPQTQLALIRRDSLCRNNDDFPSLDRDFYEHMHTCYYSGRTPDIIVTAQQQMPDTTAQSKVEYGLPFYIITRTHARPDLFIRCRNSIERQTSFDRIIHVVTYEDEKDFNYIPADCAKVKVTPRPETPCWYETYINDALDTISGPGLVMFLDDDDYIINGNFVESLLTAATECDAVFFRTALHAGKNIPATLPFSAPPFGDIASCSYILRIETAKQFRWEAGHAGDFRYINQIYHSELLGRKRIAWCPDVLTATQQGRSMGRPGSRARKTLQYHDGPIAIFQIDSKRQLIPLNSIPSYAHSFFR